MNEQIIKIQATRRGFLKSAAALMTYGALRTAPVFAADVVARRKIRTGVQLWSVRKLCDKDFPGTLKSLKEMGYAGVQCGGFYGRTAKELRTLFADTGLAAAGMQMQASQIVKPENLAASVEFARELGAPYLFVPWFDAMTADGWKRFGEQMGKASDAFKAAGIRLGYHNHQHEFRDKFDGVCKWEFLYKNTSADLCQQLDIGHCRLAGEDPVRWINKYPGHLPAVHVKAASKISGAIGDKSDLVDWKASFEACEANTTEWYVVEAEITPDSLDDVRSSIQFMKKQGRA
ncbi:MAG: sugar phosphate isomerase/epimerase [Kiritimatiellae bacterium]|nr:sugar phosphate isomerase/epimerase [Kiritimatiellia bacterium]